MRALGCVALVVAFVVGAVFGLYGTRGEDPGFAFAVAMVGGLFFALVVLIFGDVIRGRRGESVGMGERLGIWAPVVAGIGFFIAWTEGLLTQVVFGVIGAVFGLILPSAIRHTSRGPWGGPDGGGGDGGG